jgi:hypothetical protein
VLESLAAWRPQPLTGRQLAQLHSVAGVALQRLADALLQPVTLLAAIVWLLEGSYVDVAIITVVASAALALGSVVMPYVLTLVEDVRLVVLGASTVRAAAAAMIAIAGWRATSMSQEDLVALLIISVLVYEIGSAVNVTTNPRSDIANIDQPTSTRTRQTAGALAGIIGGLVAWAAFSNGSLTFPASAGWLLALGGMASVAAVWFQITAPIRGDALHHKPALVARPDAMRVLANANIRRFVAFRLLFGLADLADPFLIIYGLVHMGLDLRYVGAIILVLTLAQVASGVLWTVVRQAHGSRRSMTLAALLRFAGIATAIGVPMIAKSDTFRDTFDGSFGAWLFVLAFGLIGLGQTTYLRNEGAYGRRVIMDPALFPATAMILNLTLVFTAASAMIGAWLIEAYSLDTALVVAAILAFLALMMTGVLIGPRTLKRRTLSPELRGPRKPVRRRRRRLFRRRRR